MPLYSRRRQHQMNTEYALEDVGLDVAKLLGSPAVWLLFSLLCFAANSQSFSEKTMRTSVKKNEHQAARTKKIRQKGSSSFCFPYNTYGNPGLSLEECDTQELHKRLKELEGIHS